jgi:hypothetical protein
MPTTTVPGANGATINLTFDTQSSALVAQQIALAIKAGLANNTVRAADTANGPPPTVPAGIAGELIVSTNGSTVVPQGYTYVVDTTNAAVIFGNGSAGEQILAGADDLKFFALGGSGTIAAGGGNNLVNIAPSDAGSWFITMGNGNDSIFATGSGNDTINLGSGSHQIQLGSGQNFVSSAGSDRHWCTRPKGW